MNKLLKASWLIAISSILFSNAAMAELGTPPVTPPDNPPPGMEGAPPCVLGFLPEQAKVPCVGILSFSEELSADERAAIVQSAGAVLRYNFQRVNATAVLVPDIDTLEILASDPMLVLIPDRPIHAIGKPDKPGGGKGGGGKGGGGDSSQVTPSGVKRIGADLLPVTGDDVGVAIVDTGLDLTNADLAVGILCFDAFEGDCQDENGHGTHVGGIVAALDNDIDVIGVAPNATLYAVKVLDSTGSGSDATVMAGLDWVWQHAASLTPQIRVVNMSLGRPGALDDNPVLRGSIQALKALGISVVVAAGNDASKEVSERVPATYPEVMAVASTTAAKGKNRCKRFSGFIDADTASYFTTDGAYNTDWIGVTISAPGAQKEDISRGCFVSSVGILSLKLGGGTTRMSGTSMASPHVAGVVALMIEQGEWQPLDPDGARITIRDTADRWGVAPLDSPTNGYSFDYEREGIVSAPGVLLIIP